MSDEYAYGLWPLVVISTLVLVLFAASFYRPATARDWRVMGGFTAFAVALFSEMYGFPLTIYLLSGPLGNWFPNLGLTHAQGHLWNDLIGWQGDPHFSPFHLAAYVFIVFGFAVIGAGWRRLYAAARAGQLATSGPYARVRHPQYAGFLAIMVGFMLMWPTLPTLAMFPVLVWMYRRLAIREEAEVAARFGAKWAAYAERTPRFIPQFGSRLDVRPRSIPRAR
ncbi:MAG: methyltransferase family protein [Dehalococcoidia bacterium]